MIPERPWTRLALIASALMIASCAGSLRPSASPPRLILPQVILAPCRLDRLPDGATVSDLEASYLARGLALAECDAARALAVETLLSERRLQDAWLEQGSEGADPRR